MDKIVSSGCDNSISNGYVNKVFNVSLDLESETSVVQIRNCKDVKDDLDQGSCQAPIREKAELSRVSRTSGIWRILNHRRVAAGSERRPHSMILPGEVPAPKLSFSDKVRGFKKLKSPAVFRGKVGKLASAKLQSGLKDEPNDEIRNSPGLFTSQRSLLRNKAKRHSYAGYTSEFDCSFEDLDITGTLEKDIQIPKHCNKTQASTKKSQSNISNCNSNSCVTLPDEQCVKESPKVPIAGRRSKGGDVWNYLRRISFIGKGGSTLLEKSFDSMYTLDKTIDSDYGSVDLDCIKHSNPTPKPSAPDVKSGHFRGLFRFFNSMAETARKWKNSSRSFSPREGDCSPIGSPKTQRIQKDEHQTKSITPDLCDVVSTAAGSPSMVQKPWKSCADSSSTTGFSDGTESQLTSTHTSLATIENHHRSDVAEDSSLSENELQAEQHERSDAGSETSDSVRNQTKHEKRCPRNNGQVVPDCREELFKVRPAWEICLMFFSSTKIFHQAHQNLFESSHPCAVHFMTNYERWVNENQIKLEIWLDWRV